MLAVTGASFLGSAATPMPVFLLTLCLLPVALSFVLPIRILLKESDAYAVTDRRGKL